MLSESIVDEVFCRVTNEPIEPSLLLRQSPKSSHGAANIFFGHVRDINHGRRVIAVSYDAFEPLAETIFRQICGEARAKWGDDLRIRLLHRTGRLSVGEISVAIIVSSRHRDESYLASRYVIEQVKARAPIWKKEFYEDGETEWVQGHALCQHRHEEQHGDQH